MTWELVESTPETKRLKVPGGWLVSVNNGLSFVSDPTYSWTLASTPAPTPVPTPTPTPVPTPTPTPVPPVSKGKRLGSQSWFIADWASETAWLDRMKKARPWTQANLYSYSSSDGTAVIVDSNDWPSNIVASGKQLNTVLISGLLKDQVDIASDWIVRWTNPDSANLGKVAVNKTMTVISPTSFSFKMSDFIDNQVVCLAIQGGKATNIQVFSSAADMALYDAGQRFDPRFLNSYKPFSVIRFMDWSGANSAVSKAITSTYRTYNTDPNNWGLPIDEMINLCNLVKADMWYSVPQPMTIPLMESNFSSIKTKLDSSLKIFIENSNEVWNGIFPQNKAFEAYGKTLGITPADNFDAVGMGFAKRQQTISDSLKKVFGTDMSRVTRIMGTQTVNYGVTTKWISSFAKLGLSIKDHLDSIAVAWYFDGGVNNNSAITSVDTLFTQLDKMYTIGTTQYPGWNVLQAGSQWQSSLEGTLKDQVNMIKAAGLRTVGYEGGPSFEFHTATNKAALDAAGSDPRLKSYVKKALDVAAAAGVEFCCQYVTVANNSGTNRWGSALSTKQDLATAPKYQGLIDYINS